MPLWWVDRLVFFVLAASTAMQAAQSSPPIARSERDEVLLDVVVRDKHGRLIRDLRPDEVHVTDDGTPVSAVSFRLVTLDGDQHPSAGREAQAKTPPRLITLVFEQFGPEGRIMARNGALALIKSAEGANVYYSVLAVSASIELVQPFTKDPAEVRKAVERVTSSAHRNQPLASRSIPAGSGARTAASMDSAPAGSLADNERGTEAILSRMMETVVDPSVTTGMRAMRSAPALESLLLVARSEGSVPGRKTLVYFCEGLQIAESQHQQLRSIIEAANRANLSIYPIDVSGLDYQMSNSSFMNAMPLPSISREQLGRGGAAAQASGPVTPSVAQNPRSRDLRMMESMDLNIGGSQAGFRTALSELAARTGGFLVFNTNDVRKQVRRIAEEALAYYQITYVPPPTPLDGRFRRISISVDRPKVTAQTRDGYLAVPKVSGLPMQPFEVPLFNELARDPLRHDFAHHAAVVPLRPVGDQVETAVFVESSLGSLNAEEDAAAGVVRLHGAALVVIRDSKGAVVERFARDDPFQAPLNRRETLRKTPWPVEARVALAPGVYTVETVLADKQTDRASVRRGEFRVEPWGAGPHIAGLAFVRGIVITPPGAHRALQSGDRAVDPEFDVTLPGGKGSTATVHLLASGRAGVPIRVEIAVAREGRDLARGVLFEGEAKSEMPLLSTIDAAAFPGGDYELQVKAIQDKQESVASLPLKIAAWEQPKEEGGADVSTAAEPALVEVRPQEKWTAPPPTAEQRKLLDAARLTALDYAGHLPNFICLQSTRRFEDPSGKDEWRQKDEYSQVITWQNGVESYDPIGERNRKQDRETNVVRVSSAGEFGSVLGNIFKPEAKADFRWLRSEWVAGRTAEVFGYRIAQENSQYSVYYLGRQKYKLKPALRGIVTIDATTGETLHLELEAEQLPGQMADLRITIDYEPTSVGGRDFLLPSAATLRTRVGPRLLIRNEIRFSAYRRFEANTNIEYRPAK
jgi:VWFA-related protein